MPEWESLFFPADVSDAESIRNTEFLLKSLGSLGQKLSKEHANYTLILPKQVKSFSYIPNSKANKEGIRLTGGTFCLLCLLNVVISHLFFLGDRISLLSQPRWCFPSKQRPSSLQFLSPLSLSAPQAGPDGPGPHLPRQASLPGVSPG